MEPGRAGLSPEQVRAFVRGMTALYRQVRAEQHGGTNADESELAPITNPQGERG